MLLLYILLLISTEIIICRNIMIYLILNKILHDSQQLQFIFVFVSDIIIRIILYKFFRIFCSDCFNNFSPWPQHFLQANLLSGNLVPGSTTFCTSGEMSRDPEICCIYIFFWVPNRQYYSIYLLILVF